MTLEAARKTMAVLAVAIILTAAVGTTIMTDDENESEAIPPLAIAFGLLLSTAATLVVAEYVLSHNSQSGDEQVVRGYEAKAVAESIYNNLAFYENTLSNYEQIWGLTSEHHVRMAELAASELWDEDSTFSASDILELSGVYLNSSFMLTNSTAQVNTMWDLMTESLKDWNSDDIYKDNMGLEISWQGGSMSTKSDFGFHIGSVVKSVQSGEDRVFIGDSGRIWCDGDSTITGPDGKIVNIPKGFSDISTIPGFTSGVYTLQSGLSYCGDLMPVLDAKAAPIHSGAVSDCDGTSKLITFENGKVIVDGKQSDSLYFSIHPAGAESQTKDITNNLSSYDSLLDTVHRTMSTAASSAGAVWSIFDTAGEASSYITTLAVPSIYDGIELNASQKKIITVLAMEQLARYWQDNGGELKTDGYTLSDSMSLVVRGDIMSVTGEVLYKDVIYTPFFYQDTTLKVGSNSVSRQAVVAIWSEEGSNLSGWSGITDASRASLATIESGYVLAIAEMEKDGKQVSSVDLTVSKIDIIDPSDMEHIKNDMKSPNDLDRLLTLLFVIVGALALLSGWRSGGYVTMFIGAILIIVGIMFTGTIADALEDWFGWRIDLG